MKIKKLLAMVIATGGGVGFSSLAPGTCGSAITLLIFYAGHRWLYMGGLTPFYFFLLFLLFCLLVSLLGFWASRIYLAGQSNNDPSEVVVDEIVGQAITLLPLALLPMMGQTIERLRFDTATMLSLLAAGFLLFRLFDIMKPGIIGAIDRRGKMKKNPDHYLVMLDDIYAGLFAALSLVVIIFIWSLLHGF